MIFTNTTLFYISGMVDPRGVMLQTPDIDEPSDNANDTFGRRLRQSKPWALDAGASLTCLAMSRNHPLIAVAGRNFLQIVRIGEDRFISVSFIRLLQL